MSERRLFRVLLALVALGTPLQGQERERLARREAELAARVARLEAELTSRDSTRFVDQRRTVVTVGPFHAAFPEWVGDEAKRDLPEVVAQHRRRYGVALDSLPIDTLYVWIEEPQEGRDSAWSELRWRMGALDGGQSIKVRGEGHGAWVNWVATTALDQWAQSILDPAFARWLGPPNPRMELADLRDGTVRELILSPSSRGRRCIDGIIDECELLLELAPVPDPVLQGYDPADYRGMVARVEYSRAAGRARCVTGGEVAVCAEILRRPDRRPLRATSGRVRQSLVAFALVQGGDGAWLRLSRAAGKPVGDQLAAASGLSVNTLVSEWQRDLRDERRTTEAGLGTAFLMALAWSVVGFLFFAWRYRWRHV